MKKIIRIDYVKKEFDPPDFHKNWDSFIDMREAIDFASCNLKQRYGITIGSIDFTNTRCCKIVLDIPDEIAIGFNIGHHLRGIAAYLLKKSDNKDIYAKNKVGNRLLVFSEEVEQINKSGLNDEQRIRLLRDISILACYYDPYNTEKLKRILEILYE